MSDANLERFVETRFPSTLQAEVLTSLKESAIVEPHEVDSWTDALSLPVQDLMVMLLPVAAAYARSPISRFRVGAIALARVCGTPGRLYLGCNIELAGEALGFTVHGEQAAVHHAWLHDERELAAIAVNAAPCGHCRQFLWEISSRDQLEVVQGRWCPESGIRRESFRLETLLPEPFGPSDLEATNDLMAPRKHDLVLATGDPTVAVALDAARASYAPYTKSYSGVAIELANGSVHPGRYSENAAYNPSVSPLGSALVKATLSSAPGVELEIRRAVLAEVEGAKVSQKSVTKTALRALAPKVKLEIHRAPEGAC